MAMLAEMVDGVIGVDTHRDFNQVEIARPSGAVIATRTFTNDSAGHAETLAWMVKHAPGPRLVLSIEGTRSYGVGLARAAATAELAVIEAEQPTRKHRRGKDKLRPDRRTPGGALRTRSRRRQAAHSPCGWGSRGVADFAVRPGRS